MTGDAVDILMYHSISDGPGPTCMTPETFRRQMEALADCGYRGVALAHLAAWLGGEERPAGKPVVLTFDDGFTDFGDIAFPELQVRGWTATLFLPAGKVGKTADWDMRPDRPAQQLLSWRAVTDLAGLGVEIGAHGVTHVDLTADNGTINGWSLSSSGQTVTATRGDALTSGSSYPALTINVGVANDAPASVTNTATVTGGGALSPASASDPTTISQVADLTISKSSVPGDIPSYHCKQPAIGAEGQAHDFSLGPLIVRWPRNV
jgi:hypothetical protein